MSELTERLAEQLAGSGRVSQGGDKRRLRAAVGALPDRNAELAGYVGEVAGDAGAGKGDEASGQRLKETVVAFEPTVNINLIAKVI